MNGNYWINREDTPVDQRGTDRIDYGSR
jgi:hypothetical protein